MIGARWFADTSAWYSIIDEADSSHIEMRTTYIEAIQKGTLFVTSKLVLGELYTLLGARMKQAWRFWAFHEELRTSQVISVLDVSPKQIEAAFDLLEHRLDKLYSFVDVTSFVLMRDEAIHTAFTLDHHFAQEGFHVVPARAEHVHESCEEYVARGQEP